MLKTLAVLSAFTLGTVAFAHADTITPGSYLIQSGGFDQFTTNSITFEPNTAVIGGSIGGTFNTYLSDGDVVNFISGGPYTQGTNVPAPGGSLQLFTVSGGGETFAFNITSYSAQYVSATDSVAGCNSGDICLLITGNGNFTGSGAHTYDATPATFQFDSSYVPGEPTTGYTSFAAQASTLAATPEPASLALLGTGLLGIFGFARRRFVRA